ncbi:hypothetical protein [Paracoccus indicus]|uniref:hypothetical protein n=1 Tax=Paracoccus indicus TaxID=2079229 RepID=UPI0013B35E60|nr:hypothetical protein [Paracoccus indicus]
MTSRKQSETSDKEQGEQVQSSVYDFLYHDGRRIASFLAQFDSSGALTQITEGRHVEKATGDLSRLEGSASAMGLAKGLISSTADIRKRTQDDVMRVYDPTWANAREFLDLAEGAGLIQRDVSTASVGQLVLCQGSLTVKNLQLLTSIWSSPSAKKMMADGVKQNSVPPLGRNGQKDPNLRALHDAAVQAAKTMRNGLDLFMDLVPTFPHTVQATISGDEAVWCSLLPDGLTFDPSDITLKFSKHLPGTWSAIGILDALPDEQPDGDIKQVDYLSGAAMAKLDDAITPMIRMFLGRPYEAYGITPLLVFREIGAR